jgi:hypothetical protein
MEKQVIRNDSEFCGCEKEIRSVVIYPGANGEPIREPAEDYPMPETCEMCHKPIEKIRRVIHPPARARDD